MISYVRSILSLLQIFTSSIKFQIRTVYFLRICEAIVTLLDDRNVIPIETQLKHSNDIVRHKLG